jgi:hypothetical protein
VTDGLSALRDWALVPGLALCGVAPCSHLITNDDTAWRRVISSLMHALTCCVPLVAETPLGAWLYRRTQASDAVDLNGVETDDVHQPISVDNLMISQKDVAG